MHVEPLPAIDSIYTTVQAARPLCSKRRLSGYQVN
jgi:hypothetical protein